MKLTAATNGDRRYFSAKLGWREHFDPREMEMLAAGAVPMLIRLEQWEGTGVYSTQLFDSVEAMLDGH